MYQVINPDKEIKITISCYGDKYIGFISGIGSVSRESESLETVLRDLSTAIRVLEMKRINDRNTNKLENQKNIGGISVNTGSATPLKITTIQ